VDQVKQVITVFDQQIFETDDHISPGLDWRPGPRWAGLASAPGGLMDVIRCASWDLAKFGTINRAVNGAERARRGGCGVFG
jgi:hypothetical protein